MKRRALLAASAAVAVLAALPPSGASALDATDLYVLWIASGTYDGSDPETANAPTKCIDRVPELVRRGLLVEVQPEVVADTFDLEGHEDFRLFVTSNMGRAALQQARMTPRSARSVESLTGQA